MNLSTNFSLLLSFAAPCTKNLVGTFSVIPLLGHSLYLYFPAEELEFIRQNPTVWNIHSVLNVLYSLVDKSNINQQLEARCNS